MSAGVPAEAITAALAAMWEHSRAADDHDDFIAECCVAAALEAAAPAIAAQAAAAERERIRELAISENAIVFRAVPAKLTGETPTFETSPFADLLETP